MKFKDLAWGAFAFAGMTRKDYMSPYQALATDSTFLSTLKTNPSINEFQRLRDFLTHFGVPWAPINLASQYMSIWSSLQPCISRLTSEILENSDFGQEDIADAVKAAYSYLQWPHVWGGDTVASKVLHFFNIQLFVMWDNDIQSNYGKPYGASGYLEFLKEMQNHAIEALIDFKQLNLPGTPSLYLSQQLGYTGVRPLTKLLDDYNWVTITKRWPSELPDWLSSL